MLEVSSGLHLHGIHLAVVLILQQHVHKGGQGFVEVLERGGSTETCIGARISWRSYWRGEGQLKYYRGPGFRGDTGEGGGGGGVN